MEIIINTMNGLIEPLETTILYIINFLSSNKIGNTSLIVIILIFLFLVRIGDLILYIVIGGDSE